MQRACLVLGGVLLALAARAATVDPFADSNGSVPPASAYTGPLFRLSHHYPSQLPPPPMPWRAAVKNGRITVQNAPAYVQALKESVAADMRALLDYRDWDAGQRGWYNDPWVGAQREPIHGLVVGVDAVDNSLFPKSALAKPFTTYVITYYNRIGAQTLGKIWGETALHPVVDVAATQYAEGSVTVKLAFTTADASSWPAMQGSPLWPAYIGTNATTGKPDQPQVEDLHLMQVDVVVKDTLSAPQTGWVFTTLVYDKDAPRGRNGAWDQMVPLGAQWGNDPGVASAGLAAAPLQETWVNPAAPLYATETLGWGGRLSGPNDHALNDISFVVDGGRRLVRNARDSSCLSCHGTSQWNPNDPATGMASFILPLAPSASGAGAPYLNSPAPGSQDWLRWFQNRPGNVPMDAGSVAGDFDLALVFRVLPAWVEATTGKAHVLRALDASGKKVERDYAGRPRP